MFKGTFYYFKLCWKYSKRYPLLLLVTAILKAAMNILVVVLPKFILDALFGPIQNREAAMQWVIIYVIAVLVVGLLTAFFNRLVWPAQNQAFYRFERDMAMRLMDANYETIETPGFLDLKQKASRYIYSGGYGFGQILVQGIEVFSKILTLLGLISVIFLLSPWLILAVIILVLLNGFVFAKSNTSGIKYRMKQAVQERRLSYYADKMGDFQYGKEIRNYNLYDWFGEKYNNQIGVLGKFYGRMAGAMFASESFNAVTLTIQLILSYFLLMKDVFEKGLAVGNFTMYLAAVSSFSTVLSETITSVIKLSQYNAFYEPFMQYYNLPSRRNASGSKPSLPENYDIEFRNVSFKYGESDNFALKNINVKINSKERIAIIGENGAGKTTFIKLLMRLYEPVEGDIFLNGVNIKEINYDYYQSLFASVFQDFKLFSFTIKENICFSENPDSEKLDRILKTTGLQEVVEKLDKGLDTFVYRDFDDEGFTPSGGEGQKIAIARAAYKDSPVVILDEPTSALDPAAESQIYEQFASFFKDKCSLYISHRMAVTKFSSRTLVFDNGEIVQDGSHDELMKLDGKYKELYDLQAKYYV